MKKFVTGIVVGVVLIVLLVINIICNMNGVELDMVVTGTSASLCAMLIYEELTKKMDDSSENKNL